MPVAATAPSLNVFQSGLHWAPLEANDARVAGDLKLILGMRDFRALSGSVAVRPSYYRGRDTQGNAITVRVVADTEMAA